MSLTSPLTFAAEHTAEAAVSPYLVGVIVLAILLALLFGLTSFGKGRDHS